MEEQDINELLKYLADHGFHGEDLETALITKIRSGLPEFSIDHSVHFSHMQDLTVNYRLRFKKNRQANGYLFKSCHASCFLDPDIPALHLGAIDTFDLNAKMNSVDWKDYYYGTGKQSKDNYATGKLCVNSINKLLESGIEEQQDVARRLMYKHWPHEQLDPQLTVALGKECFRQRDFSGVPHANLCFYILTGRLDSIYEKIRDIGLVDIPGFDLYNTLCERLTSNPEFFNIKADHFGNDGYGEINLGVINTGKDYELEELNIEFARYPAIEHAVISGIDTARLDQEMAAISWRNDLALFHFRDNDVPQLKPNIETIVGKMNLLREHPTGQKIYDLLSLRFWDQCIHFQDHIRPEAWELLGSLPRRRMEFPPTRDINKAMNLVAGRSVIAHTFLKDVEASDLWIKLLPSDEGPDLFDYFKGPTVDEVEKMVFSLPLVPDLERNIIFDLISGQSVLAEHKNGNPLRIEVNAPDQTLNIFSVTGKPIPVNIHFDPDWKPPSQFLDELLKTHRNHQQMPTKKRSGNGNRYCL